MKMMIGNEIHISQDDSYALRIDLTKDGEAYTLQSGDGVFVNISSGYSVSLMNDGESYVIWNLPKNLKAGEYKYDITFHYASGENERLIYPTRYHVAEAVADAEEEL